MRKQISTCFKQIHLYKTYNSPWCLHAMTTKPKSCTLQTPVPSKRLLLRACCHKPCVLKRLHLRKGGRATAPSLLSLSLVGWYLFSWKPHFWSTNMPNGCTFLSCFFPSNERRFSELFHYLQKNTSSKLEFLAAQVWMKITTCWNHRTSFAKKETSFCPGTFFVHIGSDIFFTSDRRRDLAHFAKVVNFSKGWHHHQQLQRGHCQLVHCQFLATKWLVGQSPRFFESNRLAAVGVKPTNLPRGDALSF